MYNYFVSFSLYKDGTQGFGNTIINSKKKFTSIEQIRETSQLIGERNNLDARSVIILSFQLMDSE